MNRARILVVDDASHARAALAELLRGDGYAVDTAADGFKALGKLVDFAPDVVLTDLKMPGMDGIELLRKIRARTEDVCVLVMTAFGAVDSAVAAMKEGAADYLAKPIDLLELASTLEHQVKQLRLRRRARSVGPPAGAGEPPRLPDVTGDSVPMQEVARTALQAARSRSSVLITGESGTWKGLIAAAIHRCSPRSSGPFVRLSCAGWGETALDAALFGHERGSIRDAPARAEGKLREADGGTLFLDALAAVSLPVQAKLLRFLEEQTFERVGGGESLRVDVRVIGASRRDLEAEVRAGRFREDLFYRLSVVSLRIPPLRERPADIGALCRHLLARFAASSGKTLAGFSQEALVLLGAHGWPGNVGELENVVERAVVLCDGGWILPRHLPAELQIARPREGVMIPGNSLEEIERYAITKTLEATGGSTSEAAEVLGISARKIQYKMHEYRSAPKAGPPVVAAPVRPREPPP